MTVAVIEDELLKLLMGLADNFDYQTMATGAKKDVRSLTEIICSCVEGIVFYFTHETQS